MQVNGCALEFLNMNCLSQVPMQVIQKPFILVDVSLGGEFMGAHFIS